MSLMRSAGIWLVILVLAILNGALREAVLLPRLGNPAAQLLSGALLIALILVTAWLTIPRGLTRAQGLWVGALWVVLTLAFEFGFGRFAQGKAWSELLEAYTFRNGNIWPLVLLATFLAPWLAQERHRGSRVR